MLSGIIAVSVIAQDVKVSRNVRYRDGESQKWTLDIAQPSTASSGLRPAIVIIHGGGWSAGSKNDPVYQNLMNHYAQQGYVALSVGYRLTQEAPMPACIEDVKCAVRWLKAHAKDYGVDPERIGCYGHSAGGHLSLMLGVSSENKELEGDGPWKEFSSSVTCACGGAPPTEIGNNNHPWSQHPEWWPIGYEKADTPPLLLLQGSEDPIVRPNLTEQFVNNSRKAGNKRVEFIKIAGQHGVAFDTGLEITLPAMDAFFARHLKHETSAVTINQMKVVDGGGSGKYRAVAVSEKSLPKYVVYHPIDMAGAVKAEGRKLPVMLFANGGCMDTSVGYENMLTEIASNGYVVVAIGEMQIVQFDRPEHSTESVMLEEALNWVVKNADDKNSQYYGMIDTKNICAGGHSCGGAQVLFNAKNPLLKTYLIFNAGMGTMEMAGASSRSLSQLHGPIIYLIGGEGDVAYPNAQKDYEAITKVPIVLADNAKAGHSGTYNQKFGGTFAKLALKWMDWQLKGKQENSAIFLQSSLSEFPEWTVKSKNFK